MIIAVTAHPLVHLNATLNALATMLLVLGYVLIKRRQLEAHARTMMAALGVSCLFLISYLIYHSIAGSVRFTHPGAVRYVYLTILLTHVVLAVAVPFSQIVAFLVSPRWISSSILANTCSRPPVPPASSRH